MSAIGTAGYGATPPADDVRRRSRAWRSRLIWFAGFTPVALVLGSIGWVMATADLRVHQAADHLDANQYQAAYGSIEPVAHHDLIQQWRADYDVGTVRLQQGRGPQAVTWLERSRDRAPETYRCQIQINLALAYDAVGDAAAATELRQDPHCTSGESSDSSDVNTSDEPSTDPSAEPDDSSSDEANAQEQQEEQERQDQLATQQAEADADAEQQRQESGGGGSGGPNW